MKVELAVRPRSSSVRPSSRRRSPASSVACTDLGAARAGRGDAKLCGSQGTVDWRWVSEAKTRVWGGMAREQPTLYTFAGARPSA